MRKIPIASFATALVLVCVLLAYMFTYQVRFSEVAVRVRLGKADEGSVVNEPGIKPRYPWPIDSVVKYDRRLQLTDTPETEIKTRDGKNIIVGLYALWRIDDPLKFLTSVETVNVAVQQMRTRINKAKAEAVGERDMSTFVSLDDAQIRQNYAELEQQLLDSAGPGLRSDYGIELVQLGIRRISLPEEVTQSVFQQMIQEREALATRYRQEGIARANAIKGQADSDAEQILSFADRKAQEIESTGIQASTRILAGIAPEDREFFNYLRWLDALKASLKERATIFLDANSSFYKHFEKPYEATQLEPPPAPSVGSERAAADHEGGQ